uniref:Secreted protein n=1 Tax=Oryza barthii TaxID=65489 RepID=A0A0D3ESQ3_9ORYZ
MATRRSRRILLLRRLLILAPIWFETVAMTSMSPLTSRTVETANDNWIWCEVQMSTLRRCWEHEMAYGSDNHAADGSSTSSKSSDSLFRLGMRPPVMGKARSDIPAPAQPL